MTSSDRSSPLSRRAMLAGTTATAAATAGCVGRLQGVLGSSQASQLSLEIKTLPLDSDPFAVPIARQLQSNLEAVGMDVTLRVMDVTQLSQQVLLNHEFDIYVGQFPSARPPDPDALYPLLNSRFAGELGWQNPFGYTHLTCDDLLDAQRSAGGEQRRQAVTDLQELVARTQPFAPLVFPDIVAGVRTDRFTNWSRDPERGGPTQPHNLLQLEGVGDQPRVLRLAVVDDRLTANRNPISAAYKQQASLLDLVYDSVALDTGAEQISWLARDITWADGEGPPEVEIRLREDLLWHDGEQLSAYDVGFTYEFLRDTSLGGALRPIPTERFRGRISLVDDVSVKNATELSLSFTETTQPVARRALTVPVLPAHIWRDRTDVERPPNRAGQTTAALTSNNGPAVGSGPLQFEGAGGGTVEFSRFQPHFLWRSATDSSTGPATETGPPNGSTGPALNDSALGQVQAKNTSGDAAALNGTQLTTTATETYAPPPEGYGGLPAFDTVTVQTVSSATGAAELVISGDADATATKLGAESAALIEDSQATERIDTRSNAFYHLGFNTRSGPLRNPNVRRLVVQLVDKSLLADEVFGGNGVPAASPLAETEWLADALQWNDADPEVPFIGTDGDLDVEDVRSRFRNIGYEYNSDNELIS